MANRVGQFYIIPRLLRPLPSGNLGLYRSRSSEGDISIASHKSYNSLASKRLFFPSIIDKTAGDIWALVAIDDCVKHLSLIATFILSLTSKLN